MWIVIAPMLAFTLFAKRITETILRMIHVDLIKINMNKISNYRTN